MKKILFAICLLMAAFGAHALDISNETVSYKVMYKWGLINKQAGTVDITMKVDPNRYHAMLTAASAPWADKLYKVRDTLWSELARPGFVPISYRKHAHEADDTNYDQVLYSRRGATVVGENSHVSFRNGKLRKELRDTLEAEGTTIDMLAAYYYMRTLPFENWQPGQSLSVNIFSGKRKELLTIKYHGIETVEYDKKCYSCYKITFIFTSGNKKKTSDDMFAWIETGPQRIPVKLEGKLPVGSVKCFYTGK